MGVDVSDNSDASSDVDSRQSSESDEDLQMKVQEEVPAFGIKPSSSPRPIRRLRSRSSGSSSKKFKAESRKSPETSEASRKFYSADENDDPEYSALVQRLQKRIGKKSVAANSELRTSVSQSANKRSPDSVGQLLREKSLNTMTSNEHVEKVSFVDMFAMPKQQEIQHEQTSEEPEHDTIDALSVSDNNDDVINDVEQGKIVDSSKRTVETKTVEKVHRKADENTPLLAKPVNEQDNIVKRRLTSKTSGSEDTEQNAKQTGSASDLAGILPADQLQRQISAVSNTSTNQEVQQKSLWKRFLGIFSCFVIICGVWKCFSK